MTSLVNLSPRFPATQKLNDLRFRNKQVNNVCERGGFGVLGGGALRDTLVPKQCKMGALVLTGLFAAPRPQLRARELDPCMPFGFEVGGRRETTRPPRDKLSIFPFPPPQVKGPNAMGGGTSALPANLHSGKSSGQRFNMDTLCFLIHHASCFDIFGQDFPYIPPPLWGSLAGLGSVRVLNRSTCCV